MAGIFELIEEGDAEGIRALFVADPAARDLRDDAGLSPLMHAAYKGCGPVFAAVLEAGEPTDPWDRLIGGYADGLPEPGAWTRDGFTPLHLAAFVDNVPAATALLEAGADPDALATASFARVTPLGTCAFSGALGVTRLLLEHGADPHIGEDGVYTVEAEAIARDNRELASLIETAGAGRGRKEAGR
jgi:ankyrin repeat protein